MTMHEIAKKYVENTKLEPTEGEELKGKGLGPSEKHMEAAVKRHEDAFNEELENLTDKEMRQVILKTKKSVLEQARSNQGVRAAVEQHDHTLKILNRDIRRHEEEIAELANNIERTNNIFKQAIELLQKKEGYQAKSLLTRFKEYWFFWL